MDNWNDNWGENNNDTPSYGQDAPVPETVMNDGLDNLLSEEEKTVEDTQEEKPSFNSPEDIINSFEAVPASAKSTLAFSERQVYRIINLVTVMDYCDEEDTQIISTVFGVRGKNVRKAMSLVETEGMEIENRIVSVSVLKKILQSATGEGIGDPIDFAIELFSQVSSMDDKQLTAMISLVKSFQDASNEKKVRINRSTPPAEIIKEIKAALEVEDVALAAAATGDVIDLVSEALK